jgi:hypothetical protein
LPRRLTLWAGWCSMTSKSNPARYQKCAAEWMGEGDNLLAGILCSSPPVRPLGGITVLGGIP